MTIPVQNQGSIVNKDTTEEVTDISTERTNITSVGKEQPNNSVSNDNVHELPYQPNFQPMSPLSPGINSESGTLGPIGIKIAEAAEAVLIVPLERTIDAIARWAQNRRP